MPASKLPELVRLYLSDNDAGIRALKVEVSKSRRAGRNVDVSLYTKTIANFYYSEGKYGIALRWFRKHVGASPDSGHGHSFIGHCLLELGRKAEAEQAYQRARDLGYEVDA